LVVAEEDILAVARVVVEGWNAGAVVREVFCREGIDLRLDRTRVACLVMRCIDLLDRLMLLLLLSLGA